MELLLLPTIKCYFLRIIAKKPFLHPTNDLFIEYKLIKLQDMIQEQNLIILAQARKNELPEVISSLFILHTPRNTRLIQHFEIPFAGTMYRQFAISVNGPRTWNKIICPLFPTLEDVPTEKMELKKVIRTFFWNKYLSEGADG